MSNVFTLNLPSCINGVSSIIKQRTCTITAVRSSFLRYRKSIMNKSQISCDSNNKPIICQNVDNFRPIISF